MHSICIVTLARIWVTSLIREDHSNAAEIYSMVSLLAGLEALLGAVNACLPVIRPVFTKLVESKVWSSLTATIGSNWRSPFSRSSSADRRSVRPVAADEMHDWPSPKQAIAPRFVGAKAADMMFSHHSQISGAAVGAPRSPPRSPYHQSDERISEEKRREGITVQMDWDVERGESGETERRLMREEEKFFGGR